MSREQLLTCAYASERGSEGAQASAGACAGTGNSKACRTDYARWRNLAVRIRRAMVGCQRFSKTAHPGLVRLNGV